MIKSKKLNISLLCLAVGLIFCSNSFAQTEEWKDTLNAAVKTDTRKVARTIGKLDTGLDGIRGVVSPLGEGDPIRWAQGLPGVTTGADGTAAFYVRGGNMGNNLFSLDGVPVYGYSHLLGMTTIVPQAVMESATLSKGGFDGNQNNFTAAHLQVVTKTPNHGHRVSAALNNFLLSVNGEASLSKRVCFIASARISPLTWEYKAIKGSLANLLGDFDDFKAQIGDFYGKVNYTINSHSHLEVSGLVSRDKYSYSTTSDADETIGWDNALGLIRYTFDQPKASTILSGYINYFGTTQKQDKVFREVMNHLSLKSEMTELSLSADRSDYLSKRFSLGYGLKFRRTSFKPGQVASVTNKSNTNLADVYVQANYKIPSKLELKLSARGNYFSNTTNDGSSFDPEASFAAKWNISPHIAIEGTFDRLVQYYHTLEGLPVGWSIDMIVPSGKTVDPETAMQGNFGTSLTFGKHSASIGGFYKKMDKLVYYKNGQTMFSGALANWEQNVEQGKGTSYGGEFLYEYQGKNLYTRIAYTLSKTDRKGFPSVYDGGSYHARFDRTHVLNVTAQWKGISATFILQSGQWENGAAETYPMHILGDVEWIADYYSGINNYHMPMVLRLDLGYQFKFTTGRVDHLVNVGVCNVTNHFNPFMIYFDTKSESWKEIALLPIMPNFSYRISF